MSEQLKRFVFFISGAHISITESVDGQWVKADEANASLAAKESRIAELEAERDEWRRLFNEAGTVSMNARADRDQLAAKIESLEVASGFACGLADEVRAALASTPSEDGLADLASAKAFEAAMPGYKAMVEDAKASRAAGRRIEQPSNMFKAWLECCAQHARIVAAKEAEIARLNQVNENLHAVMDAMELNDAMSHERAQRHDPVAYVLFRDGEVCYETDDNIVISNKPGDSSDLYQWLPVYTAQPASQADGDFVRLPRDLFSKAVDWIEDRRRFGDAGTIHSDWLALKAIQRGLPIPDASEWAQPARQVGGDEREYHCDYAGCSQKAHPGTSLCLEHHTPKARAALAPAAVACVMPERDDYHQIAFEIGGTESGAYHFEADELDAFVARLNRNPIPVELLKQCAEVLRIFTGHDCHANLQHRYGEKWWEAVDKLRDELRALLGQD